MPIEDPNRPEPGDEQALEESEELAEAREAESSFIGSHAAAQPPLAFYKDPVEALAHDPLHLDNIDLTEFDIPMVVNEDVIRWMNYFTGKGRKHYVKWLGRSSRYRPMMYAKLDAAGLPRDLVYLSMIESGYSTNAYSHAAAAGLWQFIGSTGRMYGLRVDWWIDERRDPELATDAAIRLLGDLYKQFGDWYLAWAAYNGGPNRVQRAVTTHGTKDFFVLVERGSFPSETDNYIPKLLAAAIIGHHPERYGFTGIEYQAALDYETIVVEPNISTDVLARCAGIKEADFLELNPHIRQGSLPPSPKDQFVHVPRDGGSEFLAALAKVPADQRLSYQRHTVKKGESLGSVAKKYGVSVAELQRANKITNANKIYPGQKLVIPVRGGAPVEALASAEASSSSAPSSSSATTSTKASTTTSSSSSSSSKSSKVVHTVKKGESLGVIAEQYGVSQTKLKSWNGINNANRIYVGQKLVVYTAEPQWATYAVKRGDTLSAIASRNGCSVSDLKDWNGLTNSRIYPGQTLKVKKGSST